MSSVQANNQQSITNGSDFTDSKLQECLTSIYDSSRIATEINSLETKLNSLQSIRQTLVNGETVISATSLDQMNNTIGDIEKKINAKKQEMGSSEKQVIKGFLDVIQHVVSSSNDNVASLAASWKDALSRFSQALRTEFKGTLSANEKSIAELKETKLDSSEKEVITNQINEFKANMLEVQKSNMNRMIQDSTNSFKVITTRIESVLRQFDHEKVTANVQKKVIDSLEDKLKEHLQTINTQTQEAIAQSKEQYNRIPENITEFVKKEINNQIGPANLQKIIQSLPEYQVLKEVGKTVAANGNNLNINPDQMPNFEAIKQSVLQLSTQLVELKQSSHTTRVIVDTLRTQALPQSSTLNATVPEFDHAVAIKRMEEMEREVTLIHNNIKMIETMVNIKSKTMEDQQEQSTTVTIGRKRTRTESSATEVVPGESSSSNAINTEYLARLADVENKHQKLLDFILQCKDTVLDDLFPTRLEAAMTKIEQVLLNHEKFIGFLIDPFTTSKTLQKPSINTTVPDGILNPAMIDAISQLVKQTAEEIALPLQNKIKILEEKLEARQ